MGNFWLQWAKQEEIKQMRRLAQCARSIIDDRFRQYHYSGLMEYPDAYKLAEKKANEFLRMLQERGSIFAGKIRHGQQSMMVAVKKDVSSEWVWSDEVFLRSRN